MPGSEPSSRTFAGREAELLELEALLESASSGRGRVVLVHGEAGIGKTSLAEQVCERAVARGGRSVWGRCWDPASAPVYWPWAQVIRALAPEADRLDAGARERVLGLLAGDAAVEGEERLARFLLFDAVGRLLQVAGRDAPLVVVLDDLHDADLSSLRLLDFAARAVHESACIVVGTYREVEARRREDVHGMLERIHDALRIELAGLAPANLADLVGASDARVAQRLHEHTDGNPFFALELLRLLRREQRMGDLTGAAPLPVPDSVRATLSRRLAALSLGTRDALGVLAVAGLEVEEQLLTELLGEEAAGMTTEEAEREQLLRRDELGRGVRFVHALVQAAVRGALPAALRARHHRSVAEALERTHAGRLDPHLAALAHHYARAAGADAPRHAWRYARAAGDRARRMLAYDDAIRQYEVARELAPSAGAHDADVADLLLALGEVQILAGAVETGRKSCLEAEALADASGDPSLRPRIALGYSRPAVEGGIVNDTVVRLLQAALPEADARLRPRLQARLAAELLFSPEAQRRERLAREAVEEARGLGDPGTLTVTLRWAQTALGAPENTHECLAMLDEVDRLAHETGDLDLRVQGLAIRTIHLLELGRASELQGDVAALRRIAADIPIPAYRWYAGTHDAREALMRGQFETAEKLVQRQLEQAGEVPNALAGWLNQMLYLRWERGGLEQFEPIMDGLIEQRPGLYETVRAWRPKAKAERGARAEALEELRVVTASLPERPGAIAYARMMDLNWMAEAAALLADAECACALHAALEPYAGRHHHSPVMTAVTYWGSTDRHLGNLAHVIGEYAEAVERHHAALDGHLRMGAATYAARSQYELARALFAVGKSDEGGRRFAQARAAAERLGMTRLLERMAVDAPAPRPSTARVADATASARLEGEYWSIGMNGRVVRIRDTKGIRYLLTLLERPGESVHVFDLQATVDGARVATVSTADAELSPDHGGGAPVLDGAARRAYRTRLAELQEDAEEAERFNDPERAARAREEIEFLAAELERATGLGGRQRTLGRSVADQTRVNVTKAIKTAIRRLEEGEPEVGRHLRACVRTGMHCSYSGDIEPVLRWTVRR